MAFPAVIFMKLQMFNTIMCRSVKSSSTQIQHTNIESMDKNAFMHKIKYGFHCTYFHATHSHSVHVCSHLIYQTLSKSDTKCTRYGQNFSRASMNVTELIFFKVTLPWQISVGLLYQILWKVFKCLDVWIPVSLTWLLNGMLLWTQYWMFILVINQPDVQNLFYNKFISCLYMFRAPCAHRQEVKLYYTASGIITSVGGRPAFRLGENQSSLNLCTGRPPTGVMIPEAV